MKKYYSDESVTIYHGDCREILPTLSKVDLILADPPYFGVVEDAWDNKWETPAQFLGEVAAWRDALRPLMAENASIYWFASPAMASRIECLLGERFNILAHIVWRKAYNGKIYRSTIERMDKTALRCYAPETERILFAEASANAIGNYLGEEIRRAGVKMKDVAALFPSKTGGTTGCVSNWVLGLNTPTREQYLAVRQRLGAGYLERDYADLCRPMNLSSRVPYTDLWEFAPPLGKERIGHPCQKPLDMVSHMISASSRPGDIVLDSFMGTGTTLRAAKNLGRRAIGIDSSEAECERAAKRMAQEVMAL